MNADEDVVAERGMASMARARSLQSRLSGLLAILLCGGLGLGLLAWYYGGMLAHRGSATSVRRASGPATASDNSLPPLGPIRDPGVSAGAAEPPPLISHSNSAAEPTIPADASLALAAVGPSGANAPTAPVEHRTALERRLSGPAFAGTSGFARNPDGETNSAQPADPADHTGTLAGLLTPTVMPAALVRELPTQRLLLAKGAFIDCTLETAIDSSLPGMTTCITATDTFGVDGKVVLLERGSKLIGETRGQVQQGSARLFVLWTEARTPTGVVVPLASPGTDPLGRSGLDGEVDRHFWERFGAALLISVVDGAAQAAQRSGGSGTVIYDSSSSQGVATEALRGSIGIAPTITKNQGDRIQILVARDLDFRQVYQLRDTGPSHQQ